MRRIDRLLTVIAVGVMTLVHHPSATRMLCAMYRRHGMRIYGEPNYISIKVWFDGTDYALISLHEGCTISSNVRVLTHDWAPHTVTRRSNNGEKPAGRIKPVSVGPYSFVGTGTILMPGCTIGAHCIVGAGSVVRGDVPDFSIITGSPANSIGDTREYIAARFPELLRQLAVETDEPGPTSSRSNLPQ